VSKKDTYRSYGIWITLIVFYFIFYYLSNHAWIDEIDIKPISHITTSQLQPIRPTSDGSVSNDIFHKNNVDTNVIPMVKTEKQNRKQRDTTPQQRYVKKKISINTADLTEWELLFNIGPYRAGRILHFRNTLGGFYSVDQVGETYGLPDSVFQEIKSQLVVDSLIDQIKINQINYDSLYQHPYITKQMAYFIVKHRESKQFIQGMDELFTIIKEKDHERLRKLEPYLDFDIR